VRDPRQARHDHAQGHPARAPHPRRALVSAFSAAGPARVLRDPKLKRCL
jgi:hypothetical protein